MKCTVCNARRPRRHCPGLRSDICPACCGSERENSIACPVDCEYPIEAQAHERPRQLDPASAPNPDIRITDEFIAKNGLLGEFLWHEVFEAASADSSAVDSDVREALDGLTRTYRTLESGLYYESRPENLIAARIYDRVRESIDKFRETVRQREGMTSIRDADVLGMLVFLQRLHWQVNNGRQRGRAFMRLLGSRLRAHGHEAHISTQTSA